jgi:putative endonuclease
VCAESTRTKGKGGEETARTFLKNKGYRILDMNFRMKMGEIDIIAMDRETLVFVEVKSAFSSGFGDPVHWVPVWKQHRIIRMSSVYMSSNNISNAPVRFDVVAIDPARRITHVEDAFRPSSGFFM